MRSEEIYAVPWLSRWLIGAAAYCAPQTGRIAWKREWLGEIWHGHATLLREGTPRPQAARRMSCFALGAFSDACDLRVEQIRVDWESRTLAKGPLACLAALLSLFLALACLTGGFRHTRAALGSLYPDADQLVLLSRPLGVLGMQVPATDEQVATWVESSKWFGDVAGFVLHDRTLEVTSNFFPVLNTGAAARFHFLGHSITNVKLLDPAHRHGLTGAILRLKHPSDRKAAEAHFAKFSVSDGFPVSATFLRERNGWPIYFAAAVSLLFLAPGMIRSRQSLCYWAFFAGKAGLLLSVIALAWTEIATDLPIPVTGGVDQSSAGTLVLLLLLSECFAIRWALEDQKSRCPVCCRLVSMPVTIGTRSSLLLDRPAIEFLCTRGHGTLVLSDLHTCTGERLRWTPADRSWQEVFVHEKTA